MATGNASTALLRPARARSAALRTLERGRCAPILHIRSAHRRELFHRPLRGGIAAGQLPTRYISDKDKRARMALSYNHGILTVLEYSSQEVPKVSDNSASSVGANILDPM